MDSGKRMGAAIIVAHFAFSCTLICEFAALISEDQNWRKLIYEKPNAYVAGGGTLGDRALRANHFYRPWNSGRTPGRGHPLSVCY